MAKNKNKPNKNSKFKKRIRKTSAAILMIIALVVALIPEEITEAAFGDPMPTSITKIVYDTSLASLPGDSDYTLSGETEYNAYEIVDLGDGSYRMLWIYKAWVKNLSGTNIGVISDFNVSYTPVNNTLTIPSNIVTEFKTFLDSDVTAYIAALTSDNWDELNTYFGTAIDPVSGDFINPITLSTITSAQKMRYYLKSIDCDGYEARTVITDIVDGINVEKYIPYSSVDGYKSVTELNVAAIGDEAFYDSVSGTGKANHITNLNLEIQNNIVAIGNDAFRGASSMTSITIGAGVKNIGNRAFQACTNLSSLTFSDGLTSVGVEAFRGCNSLVNVLLPNTLNEVDDGAFAFCKTLANVDMSRSTQSDLTIGAFAFYDCPNITEINFGAFTSEIGDGAFSVTSSAPLLANGLTEISFPDYISNLGAHLFDGRYTLEMVTLPKSFGSAYKEAPVDILDEATFLGCTNLKTVIFPTTSKYASFPEDIFNDASDDFYVQGPASAVGTPQGYSYPRIASHTANVPYMYVENGITYYEVQIGNEFFRVNQDNELISFETTASGTFDLNIPASVGSYAVTSIADGCFTDVKDQIETITIPDNSISSLDANAFSDCENLTSVSIGNSVTAIGANAFYNCRNLINISFSSPANGYNSLTIGANAFTTNSSQLTLKGDINESYAPFTWAMNADNYLNENGKRVAYKSNAPSNLTVMYDNSTDLITLIDYPIYANVDEDNADLIDYLKEYYLDLYPEADYPTEYALIDSYLFSIYDKFELIYEDEVYSDYPWEKLSLQEQAIYNSIINIIVPEGIESIDAYTFFTNTENSENWNYVDSSRRSIYTTNAAATESTVAIHGGLFSGEFYDYTGPDSREVHQIGNDRIQSIILNDTTSIPAFAFESCEALKSVTLGDELVTMGELPFAGCTSLTSISGNTKFLSENGIIYRIKDDASYEIVQCLPNRGNTVGSKTVSLDTDTLLGNVSSIAPSAFKDCIYITKIDLSDSKSLKTIPAYCFNGCTTLYNGLELPTSVTLISENAFTNTTEAISVTIPNKTVSIRDNAFTPNQGLIRCYEDSTAYTYANYYSIEYELLGDTYEVSFLDYDGSLIGEIQYVEEGDSAELPDDPTRTGYTFTGWSKSNKNITENTIIIAQYETATSGTDSTTTATPTPTTGTTSGLSYTVTVSSGSGSGSYAAGTIVNIAANASSEGKVFDKWTTSSNGTYFASSTSVNTSFVMPGNDVVIAPTYKDATSTSNTSPTASATDDSITSPTNTPSSGTVLTITKPGISDTDKATVSVTGSTDNFVIKISESASAQELVEAALLASSETFDTIKYFPMDISLYDETGTVKVTDATGISVTITMPIPDELKEYGGNCKAAAVVDGKLEILDVKFLTIDNVSCIRFTATHFSPYTIYVDTGNLEAGGVVDSNPKTGDMIHPKWFLVIGLICASMVLFLKKDKKEKLILA